MNMTSLFYIAAVIAVLSTIIMLTRLNSVHALLYLIVSLLAVAVVFYTLGAPFVAALEVIIYAGAIMVLFIFVVMLLNLGERATELERTWVKPKMYIGPVILALILIAEIGTTLLRNTMTVGSAGAVGSKAVGAALYGPYLIGVELASMLLLGALVGAYHLGVRSAGRASKGDNVDTYESRTAAGGNLVRAGADRPASAAKPGLHADVH
jgi:NADH-quinone oxidoreductase subunit J